jgi:hypothetical protein
METLDEEDEPNEWQVCISFSKLVLKTVSLHYWNQQHMPFMRKYQYAPSREMYPVTWVMFLTYL